MHMAPWMNVFDFRSCGIFARSSSTLPSTVLCRYDSARPADTRSYMYRIRIVRLRADVTLDPGHTLAISNNPGIGNDH